jgi:hypothetical protein
LICVTHGLTFMLRTIIALDPEEYKLNTMLRAKYEVLEFDMGKLPWDPTAYIFKGQTRRLDHIDFVQLVTDLLRVCSTHSSSYITPLFRIPYA